MTTLASGPFEVADQTKAGQLKADQIKLRWLEADDWQDLRDMRLAALADSPKFFLSTHKKEERYKERRWRKEFRRGEWALAYLDGRPIGMAGVTWFKDIPKCDRYIEYLWIDPARRRKGIASAFARMIIDELADDRIGTIWLWVMDGNRPASDLYTSLGFEAVGKSSPLKKLPGRWEDKMALDLSCPYPETRAQPAGRVRTLLAAVARQPG
jgi:ribosomal protein S18 acetylase RimI-like enzyme